MVGRIRPPCSRPGDTVAVVAPAGPVSDQLLDAGLERVRSWGFEVIVGEHVRRRHSELEYLAASDRERAADLRGLWCDPRVSGVLCARGGYGSTRVLDHLDWAAMRRMPPKVFVGSSDITALHDAFATRLGLSTLFGPMIATEAFVEDEAAREHLRRTLFEPEQVTTLIGDDTHALVPGRAQGVTYGGTLSVIAASLGTAEARRPPEQGIALLEEVDEEPYRIDRLVTQLIRAGWFDHASGIALGSWTRCGPPATVRTIMLDRLGDLGIPILWGVGFGHRARQRTVPLGVNAELDAEDSRLTMLSPALR